MVPKSKIVIKTKPVVPKKKGGAKSVDDADLGSEDEYITGDQSNDEVEEVVDELDVDVDEAKENSDDDLENENVEDEKE